jgi:hypothetical protein
MINFGDITFCGGDHVPFLEMLPLASVGDMDMRWLTGFSPQ